jgi:sugar/nucleoside kinase (ribokinase family)
MITNRPFRISGTGCALVDYLYKPVDFSGPGFRKYVSLTAGDGGLSPGKLVFTEEFEKFCREDYSKARDYITKKAAPAAVNIGGPSIVSLIHTAQMLDSANAEVSFYGGRGKDEAGNFILNRLQKTPLKLGHYKTGEKNTPFTDVLCDPSFDSGNGERVFINNIGAAWEFFPEDLDDTFFNSNIVVFGGTALVPHIHSSLGSLLKKAKQHNAITVVNTVYDFLSEKSDPASPWKLGESAEAYRYVDLLVADMEEALRLSGTSNIDSAIDYFGKKGAGALIITHGSNPLYFFARDKMFGRIERSTLPVSGRVTAELGQDGGKNGDTTGCGDNLAGGVVASIAMQLIANPGKKIDLHLALAMGIASGGYACFYHGGTFYEEYPGQKKKIIESYYNLYLKQESLTEEK